MIEITQALVREWFDYNTLTGVVTRKKQSLNNKHAVGEVVGSKDAEKGYLYTQFFGKRYKLHRLIWLWMTGEWPDNIDHKDRRRDNNIWTNLRKSNPKLQAQNRYTTL